MKTSKVLNVLWDYFLMSLGTLIFVMAWTSFLIPNGLASGGLTGLCTIIQYGTGIEVGLTYPILNVLLLVLGFLSLGNSFGFKTIYVIALSSLLFEIMPNLPLPISLIDLSYVWSVLPWSLLELVLFFFVEAAPEVPISQL